jgi:F-type H+-transporting ATPase subunit b
MANPAAAADAQVAENLSDATHSQGLGTADLQNGSGLVGNVSDGAEHVAAPTALGFNDTGWVGIAALVVLLAALIWKVPATIGAMLDKRIGEIRRQLDEAAQLRREAEALRDEYATRARSAEADAAKMRENAHHEAAQIVSKAKADTEALMERRTRMAEDKIAAAERAALDEVRATVVAAATAAAGRVIAEQHNVEADRTLVNSAIQRVGRFN